MTSVVPLFRGEPWQNMLVLPIDFSRPHRLMPDYKLAGYCECGRRNRSDYHAGDPKQRTVSYRAEYAG